MNHFTTMILTSALAVCAQSALAADLIDDSPRQTSVHFADLDLSRVEGAASLYQRLRFAAETVCADVGSKDLARTTRVNSCISGAIATAVAQIDRPVLSAYYRSKLGIGNAALREASN
jgi:UrcA family protein